MNVITNPNYKYRIADFMVDILSVNMDNQGYANAWQAALNDLVAASGESEITHIQLRTFWRIPNVADQATWNFPEMGATDGATGGQQTMSDNWKRWVFGSPEPTYGPCAAKRIHDAGRKLEFCLSTSYPTVADAIPVLHAGSEASYPAFNGEIFLTSYMDNILRPAAQFLASNPNFQNGDILMITFEMCYPYAEFHWNHNAKWIVIIDEIRQIFTDAGKSGVLLTTDINGWYNDEGLGYNGLQALVAAGKAPNPISSVWKGFTGATYLSHLDFISVSHWITLLLSTQVPTTWTEADVNSIIVPAWSNSLPWSKAGTGYAEYGRNFIDDFWTINQVMGKHILTNCGWMRRHAILAAGNPASGGGGAFDADAQKFAWMGQIRAYGANLWCCGQDFERYCENQSSGSNTGTSWRNSVAQPVMMTEINAIVKGIPTYQITLVTSTYGQATSPKTIYNSGETATITATPFDAQSYRFDHWLINNTRPNAPDDTANPLSLLMDADHIVEPVFAQIQAITLTIQAVNGTTNFGTGTVTVNEGDTITAQPATGYKFNRWLLDANEYSTAISITATLEMSGHTLTADFVATPITSAILPVGIAILGVTGLVYYLATRKKR